MPKNKSVETAKTKKQDIPFDFENYHFEIKHTLKLTKKQKEVLKIAADPNTKMIILDGYPGTGKTILGTLIALEKLRDKKVGGITAFRSTVSSSDGTIGHLPGELESKMEYLSGPFYQKVNELLKKSDADMVSTKLFDILPSSFIRSYSFKNECLMLSEAQLCVEETLFTVATRAGEDSFVIIEGDSIMQNDLGRTSGFKKFCKMFGDEESKSHGVYYFRFTEDDIVRSGLVKFLVEKRIKYSISVL